MSNQTYQGRLRDQPFYYWNLHVCDDGLDIYEYVWDGITGKFLYRQVNGVQRSDRMIKLDPKLHMFKNGDRTFSIPPKGDWEGVARLTKPTLFGSQREVTVVPVNS